MHVRASRSRCAHLWKARKALPVVRPVGYDSRSDCTIYSVCAGRNATKSSFGIIERRPSRVDSSGTFDQRDERSDWDEGIMRVAFLKHWPGELRPHILLAATWFFVAHLSAASAQS